MTIASKGKTLKYGATTTLRFEIPESWDFENISAISVSVTDSNGADVDPGSGDATLYDGAILDVASVAHATSIVLATGSDPLLPGDRILIGTDGEIKEVREVISYDSDTRTVLIEELNFAHADESPVIGMFATYDLDLEDTTVYPKGMEIEVVWKSDTSDPDVSQWFFIGENAFSSSLFWEEFETLYPTEYSRLESRDKTRFEELARRRFRTDMSSRGFDIDRIVDSDMVQDGFIRYARLMVLESSGDAEEFELKTAREVWGQWLESVSKLPIWTDHDQDKAVDVDEIETHNAFFESHRFM